MAQLDAYLREVNSYYHSYKNMIDIEKEQEARANSLGIIPRGLYQESICILSNTLATIQDAITYQE